MWGFEGKKKLSDNLENLIKLSEYQYKGETL